MASETDRTIPVDSEIALYRQPGGCMEISQLVDSDEQDVIHICSEATWNKLIELMRELPGRFPPKF